MKHTITYFAGNDAEYIAVPVHGFATDFFLYFNGIDRYIIWKLLNSNKNLGACILPKGKWLFVGETFSFEEEMAKEIVEYKLNLYRDYESKETIELSFVFTTALESFKSLLKFSNCSTSKGYAILKHKK